MKKGVLIASRPPVDPRYIEPLSRLYWQVGNDRDQRFFVKYGSLTVFVGRLLPVIRTFIAFPP
jgi:membrane protein DedA with SNARE-associated domain